MKKIVKNPLIVLAVGILIVLGSSVGATRAAFMYKSEAEEVDFHTTNVRVALLEGTDDSEESGDMKDVTDDGVLSFPGIPSDDEGNTISGTIKDYYIYDGGSFYVDVKVDAVQTHNSESAIKGAWGIEAKCDAKDDGTIISINGVSVK